MNRVLAGILVLAVVLRVGAALYMGDRVQDLPGIYDQISYDRLAQNVVAGRGFSFDVDWWPATRAGEPTAHWSYLYTGYLAAVYALFGLHPLVARLIQAVVAGVVMPLLTYRLAARMANRTVGLLAAAISAVYIYFFYYAAALMTETFFFVAILATLNLALDAAERPSLGRWLGLGLAAGCAVLLRQSFLLFVPFLFVWLVWIDRRPQTADRRQDGADDRRRRTIGGRRSVVGGLLLTTVVMAALILPFTVRNYRAFHRFVLLNTNAGFAFFWANHPIHGTRFVSVLGPEYPSYQELIPPELLHLDEAALDQALLREGVRFVADDPVRYALLSIDRLKDYFLFWPKAESGTLSNISRVGSFGIFLPFMIYGLFVALKSLRAEWADPEAAGRRAAVTLVILFVGVYTAVHLLSWAYVRYRLPVDIVLVIFAALGLHDLALRFASRCAGRAVLHTGAAPGGES